MIGPGDELRPVRGSVYLWDDAHGGIRVRPVPEDPRPAWPVDLHPVAGLVLVAQRDGTVFDWEPTDPSKRFELCERR